MVQACLETVPGWTFAHAVSGLDAIERLTLGTFELAVLDLQMPDVGGLEVLEFVRAQDRLRTLPILVVTSLADTDTKARVIRAGATSFLSKPFLPAMLLTEVRRLLGAQ